MLGCSGRLAVPGCVESELPDLSPGPWLQLLSVCSLISDSLGPRGDLVLEVRRGTEGRIRRAQPLQQCHFLWLCSGSLRTSPLKSRIQTPRPHLNASCWQSLTLSSQGSISTALHRGHIQSSLPPAGVLGGLGLCCGD